MKPSGTSLTALSSTSLAAPDVRASYTTSRLLIWLLVIGTPLASFAPALWNGFVWDDHYNLVINYDYRGLGWEQLQWMLKSTLLGHWIPITWLTFGLDYVMWGMNPVGYHLTNLLLHAANAALFGLLALRLIDLATRTTDRIAALTGAVTASLFFSIHPLRVESVVWITERRDVLSGFFFLLAVLAYLRSRAERPDARRWLPISVAFFQFGVLSKAIVVTLPIVLLILDVYPLRRLDPLPTRWWRAENRRVLFEKLPYLPVAAIGSLVTTTIIGRANEFTSLSMIDRLTIAAYSFWFYLWKTVIPVGLSPLYELPHPLETWHPRFVLPVVAVFAISALLLLLVHRWPAGLASWLVYLVIVGPMSGVTHTGVQLAADRYSYLSCLPWAVVLGGAIHAVLVGARNGTVPRRRFALIATAVVSWLACLAVLTTQQTFVWRDAETLWRRAVTEDPGCFMCQHNLGGALLTKGDTAAGIEHFERAVAARPPAPYSRAALVVAYLVTGARDRAHAELEVVQKLDRRLARELSPLFITTW